MTTLAPQESKKRSRKVYVLWGVALALLLTAGTFCWLVLVPATRRSCAPSEEPLKSRLSCLRAACVAITGAYLDQGMESKIEGKEEVGRILTMIEGASAHHHPPKYAIAGYILFRDRRDKVLASLGFNVDNKIRLEFTGQDRPFYLITRANFHDAVKTTTELIACVRESAEGGFSSATTRAAAIDALGERKATEAIPLLIECLGDTRGLRGSDNWVGGHAANALFRITGRQFDIDRARWKDWWEREGKAKYGGGAR